MNLGYLLLWVIGFCDPNFFPGSTPPILFLAVFYSRKKRSAQLTLDGWDNCAYLIKRGECFSDVEYSVDVICVLGPLESTASSDGPPLSGEAPSDNVMKRRRRRRKRGATATP